MVRCSFPTTLGFQGMRFSLTIPFHSKLFKRWLLLSLRPNEYLSEYNVYKNYAKLQQKQKNRKIIILRAHTCNQYKIRELAIYNKLALINMVYENEIELKRVPDSIQLTGDSAATVETDTEIIRYFFFSATSINYDMSVMTLVYDDGNDWDVKAAIVTCTNDAMGETFAIRLTAEKFYSTTNEPERREIHLYGTLSTDTKTINSPYDIYLEFMGCPISPSELGFVFTYTTIEDISNVEFNIVSAVTRNIEFFSGAPEEYIGNLIPEAIGYDGNSSASVGVIEDFISTNRENKMLNIVARKTWGRVYDTDYNSYDDNKFPSIDYTKCGGERNPENARRINVREIIAVPCGFMSGAYEYLSFDHSYKDQTGKFKFTFPLEIIGYHSFFFGEHFDCMSTLPEPAPDTYISYKNRYGRYVYIENTTSNGVDNKLNSSRSVDNNQVEAVFDVASQIDSIKTGSYLKIIGNQAFKKLINLKSIDFEGSPLERIGVYAFEGCSSLETFDMPNTVKFIGEGAFKNSGISEIEIPSNLEYIEEETFRNCSSLVGVDFSKCQKLKKISRFAFAGTSVVDIWLPNCLERVERCAFKNCESITGVSFGGHIEEIATNAFESCPMLKRVEIGGSHAVVETAAFYKCGEISDITISDGTTCKSNAFKTGGLIAEVTIGKKCKFKSKTFIDFEVAMVTFLAESGDDMPTPTDGYLPYPDGITDKPYYDGNRLTTLVDLYIYPGIWNAIRDGQQTEAGSFLRWLQDNWLSGNAGDVYVILGNGNFEKVKVK